MILVFHALRFLPDAEWGLRFCLETIWAHDTAGDSGGAWGRRESVQLLLGVLLGGVEG